MQLDAQEGTVDKAFSRKKLEMAIQLQKKQRIMVSNAGLDRETEKCVRKT